MRVSLVAVSLRVSQAGDGAKNKKPDREQGFHYSYTFKERSSGQMDMALAQGLPLLTSTGILIVWPWPNLW
jgi:hypothetical protein